MAPGKDALVCWGALVLFLSVLIFVNFHENKKFIKFRTNKFFLSKMGIPFAFR